MMIDKAHLRFTFNLKQQRGQTTKIYDPGNRNKLQISCANLRFVLIGLDASVVVSINIYDMLDFPIFNL